MQSKYFNQFALRGLNRIGDLFIPHSAELPSFSESGVASSVDDLLDYAPAEDVALLNMVLGVVRMLPAVGLHWLARRMENSPQDDGALGSLFRQLNLGLRGILFTLYYGGKVGPEYKGRTPLEVIGYDLKRVEE